MDTNGFTAVIIFCLVCILCLAIDLICRKVNGNRRKRMYEGWFSLNSINVSKYAAAAIALFKQDGLSADPLFITPQQTEEYIAKNFYRYMKELESDILSEVRFGFESGRVKDMNTTFTEMYDMGRIPCYSRCKYVICTCIKNDRTEEMNRKAEEENEIKERETKDKLFALMGE